MYNKNILVVSEHVILLAYRSFIVVFFFLGWGETESTWYVGHTLAYWTNCGWYMMMNVEQLMEWELSGETEVSGENLPQCHVVHHNLF
jgi:hypothetical protein